MEDDCVTGTMGGFTHALLSSYVVVGRHVGGFCVVDVRSQVVVRRVTLSLLPPYAHPACHNLDQLTLAPSGLRFAMARGHTLYVIDIPVNERVRGHHVFVSTVSCMKLLDVVPTCVSFIDDDQIALLNRSEITIFRCTDDVCSILSHFDENILPTHILRCSSWLVVACLEEPDQVNGILYKVGVRPPFLYSILRHICVESLFLA